MAAVRVVANYRVKPGRYNDLYEGLKEFKKITQRLGATQIVTRQAFGPETNHVFMVVQFTDHNAYAKAAMDSELQNTLQALRNTSDQPFEQVTVSFNEDVDI